MKNWRTLLAAFFVAVSFQGDYLGLPIRLERLLKFVSIMALGWHVKDKDVTGGLIFQGDSPKVAEQRATQTKNVLEGNHENRS